MSSDLNKILIPPTMSIIESIKRMDIASKKILIVIDDSRKLLGVITNGDIRRWILKNGDLKETVTHIMNKSPIFVHPGEEKKALDLMREKFIEGIPVVNQEKKVLNVILWNEQINGNLNKFTDIKVPVVIMAGGKGTRLYPYTRILPKPLVPIGEIPIIERIINKFEESGLDEFYVTVNYKKNMIKSYFNDLDKPYNIKFVEENKPLGTGGSLSLIRSELQSTFFLSNCDILIEADYKSIFDYHIKNNHKITMVTSLKKFKIPYGVVEINNSGRVIGTLEKPEYNYLINTGMYIIEPELINYIPHNEYFDITELINLCIQKGIKVGTYPVSEESWLDMGQFDEMDRMIKKLGVD